MANTEYVFKINEDHPALEVSREYREGARFPAEMLARGKKQGEIDVTIHKPHGKKQIMEALLTLLSKGPVQYRSLVRQMRQNFAWPDICDSLEILLFDGIVQITFRNLKPQKAIDWAPKTVRLDPSLEETSEAIPADPRSEHDALKCEAEALLAGSTSPMKECLLQCIERGEIRYPSGDMLAERESFRKFRAILLAAAQYLHLKEIGEALPLRYLSNQIGQSPRFLNIHKDEIILLLQISREELDSVLLPDIKKDWNASFVFITPIERLSELIVRLSNKTEQLDEEKSSIEETDRLMVWISKLISDPISENTYNDLKERIRANLPSIAEEGAADCIRVILNELKKQLLKAERVIQAFELIFVEEIGAGSFARVYKAFDSDSRKFVACKVLFPMTYFKQAYGSDGEEYLLRFKREIRLLTKELRHKNIVEVQKVHMEGSPFWFTMPLANYSLEKWIKDNKSASKQQRVYIFSEVLSGVKYLHEREKYHRDLAPSNILLYETGEALEVKIADLGLAKDPKSQSLFTSSRKANYGHTGFADPEQLENLSKSSAESDIYSLGALLYYIWCGKTPKKKAYVGVECQDIVTRAMAKRGLRYKDVHEFEHDFILFVKNAGYDWPARWHDVERYFPD